VSQDTDERSLARTHPPTAHVAFATLTHPVAGALSFGSELSCALPLSFVRDFLSFFQVIAETRLTLCITGTLGAVRDESETDFALVQGTVAAFAVVV